MAGGHVDALNLRHFADQRRRSRVTGRKQACRAMILSGRKNDDSRSEIAWSRSTPFGPP